MVSSKILNKRLESRRMIVHGYRNVPKCSHNPAEKKDHRSVKYSLAEFCYENGLHFQTEVVFANKAGRADFFIEDWNLAVEVLSSETLKQFNNKRYPVKTIPWFTSNNLGDLQAMLEELRDTEGTCADYYIKKIVGEQT